MKRIVILVCVLFMTVCTVKPADAKVASNTTAVRKITAAAAEVGKTGRDKVVTLELKGSEEKCCDRMQDVWDACDKKLLSGISIDEGIMQSSEAVDWVYRQEENKCLWKIRFSGKSFKRDWKEFSYQKKNVKSFKLGLKKLNSEKEKVEYTIGFVADHTGIEQRYANEEAFYKKCFTGSEEEIANKVAEYLQLAGIESFGVVQTRDYSHSLNWVELTDKEYWFNLQSGLRDVDSLKQQYAGQFDFSSIRKVNGSTYWDEEGE